MNFAAAKAMLAVAVALSAADAGASQYCPPLQVGQTAAVPTESAALDASRAVFISRLTEQGYKEHGPYHAFLSGDTWTVEATTKTSPRGISAVTVCRSNGWLGYVDSVVD